MADIQNPFTDPQLMHPDLAAQITEAEDWQAQHNPSAVVGAIGVGAAERDAAEERAKRGEIEGVSKEFSQALSFARGNLVSLLTDTKIGVASDVPELTGPEFGHIDWHLLEAGFEAYEELDLEPKIIITPTGQGLQYWRTLFTHLYEWQREQLPPIQGDQLLDGLWVDPDVRNHWDGLVPSKPGWQVSVIAGTVQAPVKNVDRTGKDHNGRMPQRLVDILAKQPPHSDPAAGILDTHPSIEDYLMLHATQFHQGQGPLDYVGMTWLEGTLRSRPGVVYPAGRVWRDNSNGSQVSLEWHTPNIFDEFCGVRPIVRG